MGEGDLEVIFHDQDGMVSKVNQKDKRAKTKTLRPTNRSGLGGQKAKLTNG